MVIATFARAPAATAESAVCQHCGLLVDRSARAEFGSFCCAGCRAVYELIQSEGLARYYDLRGGRDAPATELRRDTFVWLEPLLAAHAAGPDELTRLTLDVQGVHCAACVWLLQELWGRHAGAVDLRVNPAVGRVELAWRAGELDLRDYLRDVERFGYRFGPPRKTDLAASRALVVRLGVCCAAALNVMIFSLCYYAGLAPRDGDLYTAFGRWSFVLATIAVIAGGWLFFRSAWQSLRTRVAHLDLPIALGIALGYGGSTWAWLRQGPEAAYFDTITIFVALMVLGRWLQERVLQRNRHALLASDGVEDLFTRRRRGSELETVPAATIEPGDELWIPPGDLVPVASTLLGAPALLSLDWIDGESRPRRFEPGATVPAGAFHAGDTAMRVVACEAFAVSRLHELLGGARSQRAVRGGGSSSRVATVYVGAVIVLASLAFALWLHAGVQRATEVALSVLVVTCPCALGLATPLAHELVHVGLRRRGIFLRDAGFLQRALRVRHVLFDKTGTLTRGRLELSARARAQLDVLDAETRAVVAQATAQSVHPVSRCIAAYLGGGRARIVDGLEVREFAGRGLELRRGTRTWRLGSARFALGEDAAQRTGTLLASDGVLLATLDVGEALKTDARGEVAALLREGYSIHVLSGDRRAHVARVAAQLGIPAENAHGELEPEAKAAYVRALDRGDTCMVGDGINDGLAFDAASCAATPAIDRPNLPARADFFYLGDGIAAVRTTLREARHLARVLRTNLALAVAYNAVVVGACLLGYVGPLAAAILMPASSVSLLALTSWRLSRRSTSWTS